MATAVVALDARKRLSPEFAGIRSMVAITKSDTDELPLVTKGIYCSAAGNAVLMFAEDSTAVTIAMVAGTYYPFEVQQVLSTNTTATLFACY